MMALRHRSPLHHLVGAAIACCAVLALALPAAMAQDTKQAPQPTVVVELFTSQGCSSCPPADRLLGELAKRDNVVALSLPVDYWDYLDWEDTLGRSEHTERQRRYADVLGLPSVYTPQIVVNGVTDVIGSHARAVEEAIRAATKQMADTHVPVNIDERSGIIRVEIGAAPQSVKVKQARIVMVPALSSRTVHIERGENSGKTITYHNVSREIMRVGQWNGDAVTLKLPHDEVMIGESDRCAVILQDEESGVILGAALL